MNGDMCHNNNPLHPDSLVYHADGYYKKANEDVGVIPWKNGVTTRQQRSLFRGTVEYDNGYFIVEPDNSRESHFHCWSDERGIYCKRDLNAIEIDRSAFCRFVGHIAVKNIR